MTLIALAAVAVAVAAVLAVGGGAASDPARAAGTQARGLRTAAPIDTATRRLGVTYGPFLGRRCRHVHRGCGLVGIDVVLAHAATRVEAIAGSQRIRLRTPGQHNGIRLRDWVGTFTHTGFARTPHPHRDLVYVGVELRIHFVDGRQADALFPRVRVLSGWG
jgi:hypothetical protein